MDRTQKQLETKIVAAFFPALAVFLFLSMISGCATAPPSKTIYTAYNIWYERPARISSVNYIKGRRIAAGTRILNYKVEGNEILFETKRGAFTIHFRDRYHPGLSVRDFCDRLFTNQDFAGLTQGMNEKEIRAIRRGAVIKGMGKQAVRVAFGPAPEHRTPNTWIYRISLRDEKVVQFDANGKVTSGF